MAERPRISSKIKGAARVRAKVSPRVAAIAPRVVGNPVGGFVAFMREQAVVGLAIGLVLGTQAKQIVDSLTANFINPIVGLLTPGDSDLAKKVFVLHSGTKSATFGWGAFVSTLISFIIVAAVIFFVIKGLRLDKLDKKKE
jgi:large conductance mechanosensitive channel